MARKNATSTIKATAVTTLLVLAAMFVFVPLYWLVVASTKADHNLFDSSTFTPGGAFLHNLRTLFTYGDSIFWHWLVNSVIYATVVAGLGSYISAACGYAFAKYRFAGRGAMIATVLGALMVPATVLAVPLFILERYLHLVNTYEGLILPLLVFPFGVYFMSIYVDSTVPDSLLDAGRVDGAGELRIFHRVALPMLMPGLVTIFLISFVGTWNNFFLPLVLMSNQDLYPLTVGLSIWDTQLGAVGTSLPLYPEVIMGSLVSVTPMLILFPVMQRYISRGLVVGALAGE